MVGQKGKDGNVVGGGGGGTFVVRQSECKISKDSNSYERRYTALMIAAGGNGASSFSPNIQIKSMVAIQRDNQGSRNII